MAQPLAGSSIATINRFGRLVVRVAMEWTLASRVQRCKHERELFLEFLFLPLDSASALFCAVRCVIAVRRRLSLVWKARAVPITTYSGFSLSRSSNEQRARGHGGPWGLNPQKRSAVDYPPPAQILGNVFCEALTTQVRNTKRRTARADGWQRVLRDASGVAPQKASLGPKGRLEADSIT